MGEIDGVRVGLALHAVEQPGPDGRILQRPKAGLGMGAVAHVVEEVRRGGDAGGGALHRAQQHADIGVLRRIVSQEAVGDGEEGGLARVAVQAPHLADRAVGMGINEARKHDHAAGLDHHGAFRHRQAPPDPGDPSVAHQDVGAGQIAHARHPWS
ncbi:hypothetical protein M2440_000028 [Methylorubrum extorquens]|nr:hypothetical protein [Methylorubrum extorquens]